MLRGRILDRPEGLRILGRVGTSVSVAHPLEVPLGPGGSAASLAVSVPGDIVVVAALVHAAVADAELVALGLDPGLDLVPPSAQAITAGGAVAAAPLGGAHYLQVAHHLLGVVVVVGETVVVVVVEGTVATRGRVLDARWHAGRIAAETKRRCTWC